MKLTNVRYMPFRVGNAKLKKGKSMSIDSSMISSRLQTLINKGYFTVEEDKIPLVLAKNSEPDENLPDTEPAPEVPAPEEVKVVEEIAPVVEKEEEEPKITKRRRKKSQPKYEE